MKKNLIVLLVIVLLAGTTSLTFAQAEHGGEAAGEHAEGAAAEHEESPLQTLFKWVNFAVLLGGLGFLLRKPAREFFEGRRKDIGDGLVRAQQTQANSQAKMAEIEQRLARLSADVSALRSAADKEALIERDLIVTEAKREIERLVEQSRQEIDRVAHSVEREIKETIADMVIDRAANTLRTDMTQDDQKRVVVRFIKKL